MVLGLNRLNGLALNRSLRGGCGEGGVLGFCAHLGGDIWFSQKLMKAAWQEQEL